jgi:hypothetical protein
MLSPWPPTARQSRRPPPRKRLIVIPAVPELLRLAQSLAPRGNVIQAFKAPDSQTGAARTWAVVFSVAEDSLPPPADLKALQDRYIAAHK